MRAEGEVVDEETYSRIEEGRVSTRNDVAAEHTHEDDEAAPLYSDVHHAHNGADKHDAAHGDGGHGHSHGHDHGSMNMQAVLLHVIGDALGNVGVIATGLIIWLTSWKYKYYCDPAISLIITMIIFSSAMPLGELLCPVIPFHSLLKRLINQTV